MGKIELRASVAALCFLACRPQPKPELQVAGNGVALPVREAATSPTDAAPGCPTDPKFRVAYPLLDPQTWVLFERALVDPTAMWESSRLWWEPELYSRKTLNPAQAKTRYGADRPERAWLFDDAGRPCELVPDQLLVLADEVLVWTVDASACALKPDDYRPRISLEQSVEPRGCRFEDVTTSEPTPREIEQFGGGRLSGWFDLSKCPLSNCQLESIFDRSQIGDATIDRGTVGWSDPESAPPCEGATEEFWQSVTIQNREPFVWDAKLRVDGRLIDANGREYWVTSDDGLFEIHQPPVEGTQADPISAIRWFSDEGGADPTVWLCRNGMD